MGTRADFYVVPSLDGEELTDHKGAVAWDGSPKEIDSTILNASSEEEFLEALNEFLEGRVDVEKAPPHGDMDYLYVFDLSSEKVVISYMGGIFHTLTEIEAYDAYCEECDEDEQDPMDFESYLEELGFNERPKL